MMKVLFRVEANTSIGLGHSVRCSALAYRLLEKQHHCILFVIESEKELLSHWDILVNDYPDRFFVIRISERISVGSNDDAIETKKLIKKNNIDWIVLDDYRFGTDYQREIASSKCLSLYLDDMYRSFEYADIVVNQNCIIKNNNMKSSKYLYGTDYFLATKKMISLINKSRGIKREKTNSILITFGASDVGCVYQNVTDLLIESVKNYNVDIHIALPVNLKKIYTALSSKYENNSMIKIHFGKNLFELYPKIRFGICAGGVTSLEMISVGIIPAVLVFADNQINGVECLHQKKTIKKCSSLEQAVEFINELIRNKKLTQEYGCNGMSIIDGEGTIRVIDKMLERTC